MPPKLLEKASETKARMDAELDEAQKITKQAREEGRPFTDDEREKATKHLAEAQKIRVEYDAVIADVDTLKSIDELEGIGLPTDDEGRLGGDGRARRGAKTVGQQIVESESFKAISDPAKRAGSWTSGPIAIEDYAPLALTGGAKATLTEDPASGGQLVQPDVQPGIVPLLFRRPVVADLIAPGTTTSTMVRYLKETVATNAAAPTAEGDPKPESAITFAQTDEPVRKIATFLPISDEMLEDYPAARSYIDARLGLFIVLTEEDQLLNGSGAAPALRGLRNRAGLTATHAKGADNIADAVFKQIMAIFQGSFLMPDGIVWNPADWQTARLEKDANLQYYGGGPFSGPYGVGGGAGMGVGPTVQFERYWGLPSVITPEQPAGEVFIGAYAQAAQAFRRGGLSIEASNSHADFFQKNLTALRAEERLALAVYRPQAFGKVNLLA